MSDPLEFLQTVATRGLHDSVAESAGIKRAVVQCEVCRREEKVDGARALRHGWPTCCRGFTMTLLSPSHPEEANDDDG